MVGNRYMMRLTGFATDGKFIDRGILVDANGLDDLSQAGGEKGGRGRAENSGSAHAEEI